MSDGISFRVYRASIIQDTFEGAHNDTRIKLFGSKVPCFTKLPLFKILYVIREYRGAGYLEIFKQSRCYYVVKACSEFSRDTYVTIGRAKGRRREEVF